jgi:hypothetical protein
MAQALRHKSIPFPGNYIAEKIPHSRDPFFSHYLHFLLYRDSEKKYVYARDGRKRKVAQITAYPKAMESEFINAEIS